MIGAAEMNPNATNVEALNALYSCKIVGFINESALDDLELIIFCLYTNETNN